MFQCINEDIKSVNEKLKGSRLIFHEGEETGLWYIITLTITY